MTQPVAPTPVKVGTAPAAAQHQEQNNSYLHQNDMVAISVDKLKPEFKKKFITNLQGKEFMTYNGLIALAKEKGLLSITSTIIQFPSVENGETIIVMAEAIGIEKVGGVTKEVRYTGIGDANKSNCNRQVGQHFIRMAETRAKGRALRDFLGIDMVMSEELGGSAVESDDPAKRTITKEMISQISSLIGVCGLSKDDARSFAVRSCGTGDFKLYTEAMGSKLIADLQSEAAKKMAAS